MEIRARLSLEVAKFKANAKAAGASFKTIASAAVISTAKLDSVIKKSSENRTKQNDRTNAQEIQSLRQKNKVISKLEAEKYRNKGGTTPGTNGGGREADIQRRVETEAAAGAKILANSKRNSARQNALTAKEGDYQAKASKNFLATRKLQAARALALSRKRLSKQSSLESKAAAKANNLTKQGERSSARSQKAVQAGLKRTGIEAEKAGKKLALEKYFNSDDFRRKLASTRYALYDISRRAAMFGVAIAGAMAVAVKSAMEFESAFTSVERTTELSLKSNIPEVREQAQALRDTLIELTTKIPVAFADLSEIATLGAQLGIAAGDVADFTETVAKFSAITGISVDQVALSFGRLAQLMHVPAAEFENLSASIAYTGIRSVATDAEILKMAESIAAASSMAGMAAHETVGLASALASLKVRPEQARGVFIRLFRIFDTEAAGATEKMDDLARVVGLTTEEAINLWQTDPSKFFYSFLQGSDAAGSLHETMSALGIVNVRTLDAIQRLANNMPVLTSALADAKEQYEDATFSSESYGLVVDDLASKLIIMQNAVAALGAALGDTLGPVIEFALEQITKFAQAITNAPTAVRVLIMGVGALTAGLALMGAAVLGGIAGLLAMRLAFQNLVGPNIQAGLGVGTLVALIKSMLPANTSAVVSTNTLSLSLRGVTASFAGATVAAKAFTVALGVIGIIGTVAIAAAQIASSMNAAEKETSKLGEAAFEAAGGLEAFKQASETGSSSGAGFYRDVTTTVENYTEAMIKAERAELAAAVARYDLTKGTEDGKTAYEDAKEKLEVFNDEIERGVGLTEESTIAINENTRQLLINSLSEINAAGRDEPFSIYDTISDMPDDVKKRIEDAGYDVTEILNGAIQKGLEGEDVTDYLGKVFADIRTQGGFGVIFDADFGKFTNDVFSAGNQLEYINAELEKTSQSDAVLASVLNESKTEAEIFAEAAEDAADEVERLNDALRDDIDNLTVVERRQFKVADALQAFADSARDTSGVLDGMGESARTNLTNFSKFMDEAAESAIEAGTGTEGATQTIIDGLVALEAQGIDTTQAFKIVQANIVASVATSINASDDLRASLEAAVDLTGMREVIRSFYELKIAAGGAFAAQDYYEQMVEALARLDATPYVVTAGKIQGSTEKALTPLEKMADMLESAFKYTNLFADVNDSLSKLGKSLQENGKDFSVYSDAGRSNLKALEDTIGALSDKSGGNITKFANDLASLRKALVQAGAPAAALKKIDDVTRQIGKTGKVSAHNVKQFAKALEEVGDNVRPLQKIKDVMDDIASGIRAGFDAIYAQGDAIDSVTLGWLDMADAADAARESIAEAGEEIDDARLDIKKLEAEINNLAADKGKLEYQLSIALKYGDTIRANEIRADLDNLAADVLTKQDSISDANDSISKSTEQIAEANGLLGSNSTTRQQLERNAALRDMALRYGEVAAAAIANAKPGEDLNDIIDTQVEAFRLNAEQMGYSKAEASKMADTLRDELIYQMNQIPKEITTDIKAETSAAMAAVDNLVTYTNNKLSQIKDKTVVVNTIQTTTAAPSASGGNSSNPTHWDNRGYGGRSSNPTHYSNGGFVRGPGSSRSDSVAAMLSNGEYVMRASAVSKYGVDFFNSINQMKSAPAGMSSAVSQQSAGNGMVYLSPEDRQLLRAAIDRPISLYTDNTVIASSANKGNQILAQRGIK